MMTHKRFFSFFSVFVFFFLYVIFVKLNEYKTESIETCGSFALV